MPRSRRVALRRRLLAWYDAGHRRLPWRFPQRSADPYRVWLAEVMLQQTQVATVIPYYERFLARFPSLEALARAGEDEVLALWSGLGYYARGRNLLSAAREALSRHGGLPASLEALRALPGFGPYTAGAVASIAFAIPAAAVDGNVSRVLARLEAIEGAPSARSFRARIDGLARELVGEGEHGDPPGGLFADRGGARSAPPRPEGERRPSRMRLGRSERGDRGGARSAPPRPGDWNQAVMELGATVCMKRAPACSRCPVAPLCRANEAGLVAEIPAARLRPARLQLVLACAVVRRRGAILLARRPSGGLFGGLWAPPSATVEPGEDARAALAGALGREHGGRWAVGGEVAACERTLTHRELKLQAFECERSGRLATGHALRWVPAAGLDGCGVPSAVRALLARIPEPEGGPSTRSA